MSRFWQNVIAFITANKTTKEILLMTYLPLQHVLQINGNMPRCALTERLPTQIIFTSQSSLDKNADQQFAKKLWFSRKIQNMHNLDYSKVHVILPQRIISIVIFEMRFLMFWKTSKVLPDILMRWGQFHKLMALNTLIKRHICRQLAHPQALILVITNFWDNTK